MHCDQIMANVKSGMKQITLFSKFQENHFSKLIELPITKNAWNPAILYANKSNHGKKKKEWTASRRNIMEEAHGGLYLAHYLQEKNSFVSCVSWTDFMAKPDKPVSDQTKSPCVCRNLTCVHLVILVSGHIICKKEVLVYVVNKNYE